MVDSHDGYFICVPFRSSICHENAFLFKTTSQSTRARSGLDYTKIIIIDNDDYIDAASPAIIKQKEYTEMTVNLQRIVSEVLA